MVNAPVLIVLPAFNEQEALPGVLAELKTRYPDFEILVVDDGSTDDTAAVARRSGVKVMVLPFNLGVGGAVRAGLLYGHRIGARAVVQCDADGQHPVEAIAELIARLPGHDLVIGARFAGKGEYEAGGLRRMAMRLLARVMTRLLRTPLSDVTSGLRAFSPRAIEILSQTMPPEYLGDTVEALVIAKEYQFNVIQTPVEMNPRMGGIASQGPFKSAFYLGRVMIMLMLSLLRLAGFRRERN